MLNRSGKIPPPRIILYKGKNVYYEERPYENFMRKFNDGFGISLGKLEHMKKHEHLIIKVLYIDSFSFYIVPMEKFFETKDVYVNDKSDIQRFVSLNDMKFMYGGGKKNV